MNEYKQGAENYINLVREFIHYKITNMRRLMHFIKQLQDYMKDCSTILFVVRKHEAYTKTKQAALKDRIEHVMKTLNDI